VRQKKRSVSARKSVSRISGMRMRVKMKMPKLVSRTMAA